MSMLEFSTVRPSVCVQGVFLLAECAAVLSAIGGGIVVFKPCKGACSVYMHVQCPLPCYNIHACHDEDTVLFAAMLWSSSRCAGAFYYSPADNMAPS